MSTLTIMSADKSMRGEYYARLRDLNDMRANKAIGFKEGLAQGRAEERAKAEKEKEELKKQAEKREMEMKLLSARKMLVKGLSVQDVADFTGLPLEEVEALV